MDRIPDSTASLPLRTLEGEPVPFESLWADGPALVAFLRHFG